MPKVIKPLAHAYVFAVSQLSVLNTRSAKRVRFGWRGLELYYKSDKLVLHMAENVTWSTTAILSLRNLKDSLVSDR